MKETQSLNSSEWEFWNMWMQAHRLLTRELELGLQRDCDISKAEFSILVTLWQVAEREMRVGELSASLNWDKSRVSHQLTRMEKRGFVIRTQYGADGRRAGVGLTPRGLEVAQSAILVHGCNIRSYFMNALTQEQLSVIRAWSEKAIRHLNSPRSEVSKYDES